MVDESAVYESRMRNVAKMANVTYEYVYETAIGFYKENKKGDLETMKLLNVEKPEWKHEDEIWNQYAIKFADKLESVNGGDWNKLDEQVLMSFF